MTVKQKLFMPESALRENGAITIVAFGDSVTHGVFEIEVFDYEAVYHRRLAKMLNAVRPNIPVNIIDSGFNGDSSFYALERLEKQVIAHNPDLVIVAFGLNDINDPLDRYLSSLEKIFTACKDAGLDVIFMTPNMLNTYVGKNAPEKFLDYAHVTAEYQKEGGRMDTYMTAAVELAEKCSVKVANCYAKWKKLAETEDTTAMLANGINHPTREMHQLFADTLFEIIMGEE